MFHQRFKEQLRKIITCLLILGSILLLVIYFSPRGNNQQLVSYVIQSNNNEKSHYDDSRNKELVRKGLAEMIQIREFVRRLLDDPYPESKQSKDLKPDYFRGLVPFNDVINIFESLNDETKAEDERELQILQERVKKRIDEIQNPKDCKHAKKFVCILTHQRCGLGCVMQHFSYCIAIAVGTNRTLIIDFLHLKHQRLDEVIKPPSDNCFEADMTKALEWKSMKSGEAPPASTPVLKLTLKGGEHFLNTPFAPFTIPEPFLEKLQRHHADPNMWWLGQMMSRLLRPQPWLFKKIEDYKKLNNFTHPIVGIHVRRSDKLKEPGAQLHELKEYMARVDEWYDRYEMKHNVKVARKLYLATDEVKVIEEAKTSFPDYLVLYSTQRDTSTEERYEKWFHKFIIRELHLLAQCDYFIGTYSSNVGIIVAELMQAQKDATFNLVSIDRNIRCSGSHPIYLEAIYNHTGGEDEFPMIIGDIIEMARYQPVSYKGYGRNLRIMKFGRYPLYKVKEVLIPAPYYGF